jgi:hypothetical protein
VIEPALFLAQGLLDLLFAANLRVGDGLDALDNENLWCVAEVIEANALEITIHCKPNARPEYS